MSIAIVLIAALFLAAGACAIAGVFLLAGVAWSLLATSILLFGAAYILRRGLITDG